MTTTQPRPAFGALVRAKCNATGIYIGAIAGKDWVLFVSAMDNDLCIDELGQGEPHPGLPRPTGREGAAALYGLSTGLRLGKAEAAAATS